MSKHFRFFSCTASERFENVLVGTQLYNMYGLAKQSKDFSYSSKNLFNLQISTRFWSTPEKRIKTCQLFSNANGTYLSHLITKKAFCYIHTELEVNMNILI